MEGDEAILTFMDEHDIPRDRVDLGSMRPEQIAYERQIFGRRIGGNAWPDEKQYEYAEKTAEYWNYVFRNNPSQGILDIGCGLGYHIYLMQRLGFDAKGLNLSVVETELARHGIPDEKKVMRWHSDVNREVKIGSVLNIPFNNKSQDAVSCYGVLMMLPHSEKIFGSQERPINLCRKAAKEFHRVLRYNGMLHLVTMGRKVKPDGERTEDYIFLDPYSYAVYDGKGSIVEEGRIGLADVLSGAGFGKFRAGENDNGFWGWEARRVT